MKLEFCTIYSIIFFKHAIKQKSFKEANTLKRSSKSKIFMMKNKSCFEILLSWNK